MPIRDPDNYIHWTQQNCDYLAVAIIKEPSVTDTVPYKMVDPAC
jgi:hypothetical protein